MKYYLILNLRGKKFNPREINPIKIKPNSPFSKNSSKSFF